MHFAQKYNNIIYINTVRQKVSFAVKQAVLKSINKAYSLAVCL